MTRRDWTFEELATLRRVYPTDGAPAAAAVLGRSLHSVHGKANELRLVGKRRDWPAEDLDALRRLYPDHTAAAVAAVLGRKPGAVWAMAKSLGLSKSPEFMASERSGRRQRGQVHPSIQHTQFKPGRAPWNKGTHYVAGGRSAETRFKPRRPEESRNYKPIGSLRINAEGYLERKFTDDRSLPPARRWVAEQRLVWEAAHGPVPPGHMVIFKHGMRTNVLELITLDRLECISRAENARRNHPARHNPELVAIYQLKGAITRQVNRINREAQESQAA